MNLISRTESQSEPISPPYLAALAVVLILGVGIFFRLYELGGRDLWTDEAWVALAAMKPTIREALAARQSTPPFYLLSLWAAVQLWGHSELVLRGISFLFGVGVLFIIWRLACSLMEKPAALIALAAVAFSPVMVYYSKELKQYSGDAFFAILLVWLAERLHSSDGKRSWAAVILAGVIGLGFSHPLIFTLPVVGAVLWISLPNHRSRLIFVGGSWIAAFAIYYFIFFRKEFNPDLVAYWTQDFPIFSGLIPFIKWLGSALYRYFWYFLGEWGVFWGPPFLAAGVVAVFHRRGRFVWYFAGPLLLAFGAACLHRYPFMAHFGGNRLMLFSAPILYLIVAAGGWAILSWLWHRRQRWLSLVLAGLILISLHPLYGFRENLYPLNNREEIQPLVAHLEANLEPQDIIYVYYFAIAPFKYYYHGPNPSICWGQSCVEKGLDTKREDGTSPQKLWLIASHVPDLKYLRQFAANLLGPDWREAACLTREGAVLLRFDRQT